jgi:hypothetical protein
MRIYICKIHTSIFEFIRLFTSLSPLLIIYKSILDMRISSLSKDNLNLLLCADLLTNTLQFDLHLSQNVVYRIDQLIPIQKIFCIKSIS